MSTPKQLVQCNGEDEEMMIFASKKSDIERLTGKSISDDEWLDMLDNLDDASEAADDFAVAVVTMTIGI